GARAVADLAAGRVLEDEGPAARAGVAATRAVGVEPDEVGRGLGIRCHEAILRCGHDAAGRSERRGTAGYQRAVPPPTAKSIRAEAPRSTLAPRKRCGAPARSVSRSASILPHDADEHA